MQNNIVIKKLNDRIGRNGKTGYLIKCWNTSCNKEIYVKTSVWENNLNAEYPRIFSCSMECKIILSKTNIYEERNLKRFGYKNGAQKPEVIQQIKETFIEKYGVENPFQNKDIQEKSKLTNIEKYGTEYYNQSDISIKNKKERILNSNIELIGCIPKDVYEKIMMEKYGVKHIFSLIKFTKQYYIEKYGYDEGIALWEIRTEKTKQTLDNFIKRHGDIIGKILYDEYLYKTLSNYGGISKSQLVFANHLYEKLNDICKLKFIGEPINKTYMVFLNKEDRIVLNQKVIMPDIVIDNIVIEYDGDYWHSLPNNKDDKKDAILKNKGYEIIRILESSYLKDRECVVNNLATIINTKFNI